MITVQISRGHTFSAPKIIKRFAAALQALAAQALQGLSAALGRQADWRSLDERLLRDIGASPTDAEIARLQARMGVAETDDWEPVASRGLSARHFMQWVRRDCHR